MGSVWRAVGEGAPLWQAHHTASKVTTESTDQKRYTHLRDVPPACPSAARVPSLQGSIGISPPPYSPPVPFYLDHTLYHRACTDSSSHHLLNFLTWGESTCTRRARQAGQSVFTSCAVDACGTYPTVGGPLWGAALGAQVSVAGGEGW